MACVAIVIVTWNSASEIGGCLDALKGISDVEIVVVDNASADETRTEVERRGIRLIANPANAGFAAAVNQGVRATTAPLLLLLNPDTHLVTGIDSLIACFETRGTGAAGGKLLDSRGEPQRGFMARNLPTPTALIFEVLGVNRMWPRNRVNWHYRCLGLDPMDTQLVDQPAGAFLMFSRLAWEIIGGFDEKFWPVWFEDVDFCARLKTAGFRTYFSGRSAARHAGAHSINAIPLENRARYWYGSLLKYADKHYGWPHFRAVCTAVVIGSAFRAVKGFPHEGLKALVVYGGVIGLALRRLLGFRET
jgi:N-acetylglucosaminyl-diphospho-decaprenol L-rhamnosyltransferase